MPRNASKYEDETGKFEKYFSPNPGSGDFRVSVSSGQSCKGLLDRKSIAVRNARRDCHEV